ncbi:MAG: hypothetical protein ACTSR0_04180 [Candidatus Asgardarchaeia archaeon]
MKAKLLYPHFCPKCGKEIFTRGWYDIIINKNSVEINSSNKDLPHVLMGEEKILSTKGGKKSIVKPIRNTIVIDDGSKRHKRIYVFKYTNNTLYYRICYLL